MDNTHEETAMLLAKTALRKKRVRLSAPQHEKFIAFCQRAVQDNQEPDHLAAAMIYLDLLMKFPDMT